MTIEYEPEHANLAVADLPSHTRGPRFTAFAQAIGDGAQVAEDLLWQLTEDRTLDAASGAQLDQWAGWVGEARQGLTDDDLRRFVRARFLAALCDGTAGKVGAVWSLLSGTDAVRLVDSGTAAARAVCFREVPFGDVVRRRTARVMAGVKPAGVALSLVEALPAGLYFGWDGDPDAAGWNVGGFAAEVV